MYFGRKLRALFAYVLMSCNPPDPHQLWSDFKQALCGNDNMHGEPLSIEMERSALCDINDILEESGLSLIRDFGFPPGCVTQPFGLPNNSILEEELSYDVRVLKQFHDENIELLSFEQQIVYDAVVASAMNDQGKCFALNAAGGCGKTFLLSTVLAAIRQCQKVRKYYFLFAIVFHVF